jgi:hypothetical protein
MADRTYVMNEIVGTSDQERLLAQRDPEALEALRRGVHLPPA